MKGAKFISTKSKILIILLLLLLGCSLPFGCSTEPINIEVIVPDSEKIADWTLSPEGDKIVYESQIEDSVTTFLLSPATGQKHQLDKCNPFGWLDNTLLQCPKSIIVTDDLFTIPLKEITPSKVELEKLLQNAGTIYKFEAIPKWFVVLDPNYRDHADKNYLVIVDDVDNVLQGYTYLTIPASSPPTASPGKKVYSPNKAYYYVSDGTALTIHNSATDEKIVEFKIEDGPKDLLFGGWAADSSGVYFQVFDFGFRVFSEDQGIKKLRVPE
ncbi:hypothetical protein ACFLXQ_07735 [Chloroflexota bacterium]